MCDSVGFKMYIYQPVYVKAGINYSNVKSNAGFANMFGLFSSLIDTIISQSYDKTTESGI